MKRTPVLLVLNWSFSSSSSSSSSSSTANPRFPCPPSSVNLSANSRFSRTGCFLKRKTADPAASKQAREGSKRRSNQGQGAIASSFLRHHICRCCYSLGAWKEGKRSEEKKRKRKGKGKERTREEKKKKRNSLRIRVQEIKEEENKGVEEQGGRDKTRTHTKQRRRNFHWWIPIRTATMQL